LSNNAFNFSLDVFSEFVSNVILASRSALSASNCSFRNAAALSAASFAAAAALSEASFWSACLFSKFSFSVLVSSFEPASNLLYASCVT
jgi:hypothetical protein